MNKYEKIIISILLKICRILSKYSENEHLDTKIFTIEKEIEDIERN